MQIIRYTDGRERGSTGVVVGSGMREATKVIGWRASGRWAGGHLPLEDICTSGRPLIMVVLFHDKSLMSESSGK